jgi:hydrogenase-4 component F
VTEGLLVISPCVLAIATGLAAQLARGSRQADRCNLAGAALTAAAAGALAVRALVEPGDPLRGSWYVLDPIGAVFLAVIAVVGLLSALVSPLQLAGEGRGLFSAARGRGRYYLTFHVFWAALLAIPLVDNLGLAWLLVEATTGASALLVAFSGRRRALEAGWKYLVLTTFGLAVALLGIVVLYAAAPSGGALASLDWPAIAAAAPSVPSDAGAVAFVLIVGGLATKVGWAPVHNWLPDAHSEAPPAVSALLSAALLPAVALVAWRVLAALGPALPAGQASALFVAFGLASLAIAVPFLWRPQPWKRLLAYSSLEHMGVIALGIGLASPLATAGVVVHVAGHALAKALGFYAAIPLSRHAPDAGRRAARGLAFASPPTATAMGVSLGALAALPPSPLFVSELLILLGAVEAGELAVAIAGAALLALGFLGLAHALIEGLVGEPRAPRWRSGRSARQTTRLTVAITAAMLALTAAAVLLPGSAIADRLMEGVA